MLFRLQVSKDGLEWKELFSAHDVFACNRRLYEGPRWRWERVWADHVGGPISVYFDGRSIGTRLEAFQKSW